MHIGGFFVFVGLAGVSLILWGLYWHCWLKKSCCMKEYHNPVNIRAFWWISFIGFCGVFACCISGIVTSYNFNNMVGSIKCAYERIYYDSQYGELKTSSTKWKGFKNNDDLFNEYKNIINSNNYEALEINSGWKTEKEYKNEKSLNILNPELKYNTSYIDEIYNFVDDYCKKDEGKRIYYENNEIILDCTKLNNENSYFNKYINNITKNFKYSFDEINSVRNFINNIKIPSNQKAYTLQIDQLKRYFQVVSEDLNNYQTNFLDKAYHYIDIAKTCGYILVIIFYSIVLFLVICGGIFLLAYSFLKEQQILNTFMHIFWNLSKFFVFAFFMFGAAFGALYLCAQDLIGYNQFLFSNDNLGSNEKTYLLPTGASKEFLRFCMNDDDNNYLRSINLTINEKIYNLYNNLKLINSSRQSFENNNYENFKIVKKCVYIIENSRLRAIQEAEKTGTIYIDSTEPTEITINFTSIANQFGTMFNELYEIIYPYIVIPTTEPITIPTSTPITIPTTEPITIPTTEPITLPTTAPITIPTTEPFTIPTTVPITIPTTEPITLPTTIPLTIATTVPITIPTTEPITIPTTIITTIPTTLLTTIPTTIITTIPTTLLTTIPTTTLTTIPTTLLTTIPTTTLTTIPTTLLTTIPTTIITTIPTTLLTTNTTNTTEGGNLRNLEDNNNEIIKDLQSLGKYIENYNCDYLKNEVQILYDALYEASIKSRISCALCCCIGFFGEISIIFYLLTMYHYNNEQFNEGIINNSKNKTREKKPKFDMESQNEFMDKSRPANIKKNNKKLDLEFNFKI